MQTPCNLLSEVAPDAQFTANMLLFLSLAGNVLVAWITLSSRKEAQRRQVSFETEFASRDEVGELKNDLKALAAKMDAIGESLRSSGELRREMIENRIAELSESVHELALQVAHLEERKP